MADRTPAAEALRRALEPPAHPSIDDHAAKLGVTRAALYAWMAGTYRPTLETRARLAQIYGIPVRDWLTAAETGEPVEPEPTADEKPGAA